MKFFKQAITVLIVLLVSLVVCEFFIRIYLRFNMVYDVEMTRYSLELKQDPPDPLIGHVHKPNRAAKLMGVTVDINSDGFRDREHRVERDNRKRFVFLGDSITLGWGVELKDTFKTILEEKMNFVGPAEIINFSVGNYNTEQEVHLFLKKGLKYRPDTVVVFYFINDVELSKPKSKLWFLGHSQMITFFWSRLRALAVRFSPALSYKKYYAALYETNQPGFIRAQNAFLLLKKVCEERGIALRVVLIPEFHNLINYPFKKEHGMILDFLKKNGIECLDLSPRFSDCDDPMDLWVAVDDAHPNKKAHQMIARYVFDFLRKEQNGKLW